MDHRAVLRRLKADKIQILLSHLAGKQRLPTKAPTQKLLQRRLDRIGDLVTDGLLVQVSSDPHATNITEDGRQIVAIHLSIVAERLVKRGNWTPDFYNIEPVIVRAAQESGDDEPAPRPRYPQGRKVTKP